MPENEARRKIGHFVWSKKKRRKEGAGEIEREREEKNPEKYQIK